MPSQGAATAVLSGLEWGCGAGPLSQLSLFNAALPAQISQSLAAAPPLFTTTSYASGTAGIAGFGVAGGSAYAYVGHEQLFRQTSLDWPQPMRPRSRNRHLLGASFTEPSWTRSGTAIAAVPLFTTSSRLPTTWLRPGQQLTAPATGGEPAEGGARGGAGAGSRSASRAVSRAGSRPGTSASARPGTGGGTGAGAGGGAGTKSRPGSTPQMHNQFGAGAAAGMGAGAVAGAGSRPLTAASEGTRPGTGMGSGRETAEGRPGSRIASRPATAASHRSGGVGVGDGTAQLGSRPGTGVRGMLSGSRPGTGAEGKVALGPGTGVGQGQGGVPQPRRASGGAPAAAAVAAGGSLLAATAPGGCFPTVERLPFSANVDAGRSEREFWKHTFQPRCTDPDLGRNMVPGGNMSKLVASRWKLRSRPVTPLQYVQVLQGQQ